SAAQVEGERACVRRDAPFFRQARLVLVAIVDHQQGVFDEREHLGVGSVRRRQRIPVLGLLIEVHVQGGAPGRGRGGSHHRRCGSRNCGRDRFRGGSQRRRHGRCRAGGVGNRGGDGWCSGGRGRGYGRCGGRYGSRGRLGGGGQGGSDGGGGRRGCRPA